MKDFPLMVKLADTSGSWVIHNRNVRFAKADAAQFEVPAGYTKMAQPAQPAPSATPAQPVKK